MVAAVCAAFASASRLLTDRHRRLVGALLGELLHKRENLLAESAGDVQPERSELERPLPVQFALFDKQGVVAFDALRERYDLRSPGLRRC